MLHPLSPRASLALALLISLAATGCGRPAPAPSPAQSALAVRLVVDADGIYEVTAADLRAAGFDLAAARGEELTLSAGGQPVAFALAGEGAQRSLRFYGQGLGLAGYTSQNIYWLVRSAPGAAATGKTSLLIATQTAAPSGGELATAITATIRAEEQRQFLPQAPLTDDPWLWAALFAPAELKVPVTLPAALPEAATLQVRVLGNSSAPANPDHHLTLAVNGIRVTDVAWDGMTGHLIEAAVPAGALRRGENEMTLAAVGDTGAQADSVLLDWIAITYSRELTVEGDALTFGGQAAGYSAQIGGPPAALWDVTDPARPVALRDYATDGGRVRFASDGAFRRFALVTATGLRRPVAISAATDGGRLRDWPGGADLIIVTTPALREALAPLVAAREAAGLRVAVLNVAEVYDSFNHGRADPAAIQALVRHARAHWTPPAPRFLLLAGDASYDPANYLRGPEADLVPTRLVYTTHTGRTASDVWFALPDDRPEALPALAVGRFPAQNAEQLTVMVAKTLAYEKQGRPAWRERAFLVADNDEPGFASEAQAFAAGLTGYAAQVVVIAGDGAGRARSCSRP